MVCFSTFSGRKLSTSHTAATQLRSETIYRYRLHDMSSTLVALPSATNIQPSSAHIVDTPMSSDTRDPVDLALITRALEHKTASLITRMLSQPMGSQVVLWNSGCIQLEDKNIMIHADDAVIMYARLKGDPRFLLVEVVHLDKEKTEWKAVYRCDKDLV
jgi:hypothetical protein